MFFSHAQKPAVIINNNRLWMNYIHNLYTRGQAKEFGYLSDCGWKFLKLHFMLLYGISQ